MYEIPDKMLTPPQQASASMSDDVKAQQAAVHQTIGRLIAVWANVESNMIHLVGRLLRTPDNVTFATYYSFGAMRASEAYILSLIVATLEPTDQKTASRLLNTFKKLSQVRNELVHCEYVLNTDTFAYEGTCYTRLDNSSHEIIEKRKPLSPQRLKSIQQTGDQLITLGQEILIFCRELDKRRKTEQGPAA